MSSPIAWEVSLPQRPNHSDFGAQHQLNAELFQPDSKVTRGRRIAEELPDLRQWSFDLTRAQYVTWQSFFKVTLKGGFVPVTFTDPVTGDPLDLLIVETPQVQRLAPDVWRISLAFEEL